MSVWNDPDVMYAHRLRRKRMKEQIKWERSGLAYALKIMTKTPNLAANYTELAKEVKMRKCIPMPMSMTKDEITDIFEECIEKILSTYPVVICKVLHDEFGFGGERLTKFMQMFRESVYSLHNVDTFGDSYCTFSEYADEFIKKYKKYGLEYNMERISI